MNTHFKINNLTLACLLVSSCYVLAEPKSSIDEIIVSASPIAEDYSKAMRSVTVITHEQIAASSATNLADILAKEGAITISRRGAPGAQADVSIRGSHFEQTLVLINGIPIQSPQTGHNNLNVPIPPSHIERIEIVEGPGAMQYGGSTTGGVINIITREGDEKTISGSVEMGYGSHDTMTAGASVAQQSENLSQRLSIKTLRADSERKNQPNDIKMYDALYTGQSLSGPVKFKWGLGSEQKRFGAWGFYSDSAPDARESITTRMAWTGLEYKENDWKVDADIYWRDYKDWFLTTIGSNRYINRHKTQVYGLKGSIQHSDSTGVTALGAHLRQEEIRTNSLKRNASNAVEKHSRKEGTAWITRRQELSDSWLLDLGLTAAKYTEYGTHWLPSAALSWQFTEQWRTFLSAARSMRAPSYTEMFMAAGGNIGTATIRPEKVDAVELGLAGNIESHHLKAALFERRSSSLIDWGQNATIDPNNYYASNFKKYRLHGLDTSWRWQANLPGLESLRFDWQWLDAKLNKSEQKIKYAEHIPNHSFLVSWRSKVVNHVFISSTVRRPHYKNQKNGTLMDLRLDWRIDRWTISMEGHNLFNKRIIETGFAPIAGRWYYLSAKLDW